MHEIHMAPMNSRSQTYWLVAKQESQNGRAAKETGSSCQNLRQTPEHISLSLQHQRCSSTQKQQTISACSGRCGVAERVSATLQQSATLKRQISSQRAPKFARIIY